MSKLECEVVKDLMPLYVEDLVSDKTRQMMADHVQVCASCQKELLRMQEGIQVVVETPKTDKKMIHYLNRIRTWYFLCPALALGCYMIGNTWLTKFYMIGIGLFALVCLLSYTSGICGAGFDYDQLNRQQEANEHAQRKWGGYRVSPFLIALPALVVVVMHFIMEIFK